MVDLPLPLAPTTATTSPSPTTRSTPSSTCSPRPNEKLTPSSRNSPRSPSALSGLAGSRTSTGVSRITCTRPSETRAVARLAYSPISPWIGPSSRIW